MWRSSRGAAWIGERDHPSLWGLGGRQCKALRAAGGATRGSAARRAVCVCVCWGPARALRRGLAGARAWRMGYSAVSRDAETRARHAPRARAPSWAEQQWQAEERSWEAGRGGGGRERRGGRGRGWGGAYDHDHDHVHVDGDDDHCDGRPSRSLHGRLQNCTYLSCLSRALPMGAQDSFAVVLRMRKYCVCVCVCVFPSGSMLARSVVRGDMFDAWRDIDQVEDWIP